MNKEQINSDKKVLESLESQYNKTRRAADSVRAFVTDINFEERVPDAQERWLMAEQLDAIEQVQTNLINRIRFYRDRVKRDENIKDWYQYKKTDSVSIGVDVSDEEDHGACCQVDDGNAAVDNPATTGNSLRNILGMQVCRCNVPCDVCAIDKRVGACIKLELIGGDYICLAPTPNTTTE